MKIKTVRDVVSWRLCVGCGACAYLCPKKSIELRDFPDQGIRPVIVSEECGSCADCLQGCPGHSVPSSCQSARIQTERRGIDHGWGPFLEIWEGYAVDAEIRYQGSSGGAASAIALYCLEKSQMHGVLHIGGDEEHPIRNRVYLSRNRSDLLSRAGSRYAPASPCSGLDKIASAPAPCVFIGKPCDVAGLEKTRQLSSDLDHHIGLSIGIFCAGTPASGGTISLLKEMDISADLVREVRYRGKGWPGSFMALLAKGQCTPAAMPYMEAWGFLQKYRPYRCYLCPDGTAAYADLSCGDPWYRAIPENGQGYSLVVVRTEKGKAILNGAIETGYLSMRRVGLQELIASQEGLLMKRQEIWGRLAMMKAFGIPVPRYAGFFLFEQWLSSSGTQKIRSLFGTVRRIIRRKYYQPL